MQTEEKRVEFQIEVNGQVSMFSVTITCPVGLSDEKIVALAKAAVRNSIPKAKCVVAS